MVDWRSRTKEMTYEDEVRPNISCRGDIVFVGIPEIAKVVSLQDQNNNPVDRSKNRVEREGCWVVAILSPNTTTVVIVMAVGRTVESVVCYISPGLFIQWLGTYKLPPQLRAAM